MGVSVFSDLAVHHCSISVPDIERSAAWYGRVLGSSVEARFALDGMAAKCAFFFPDPLRIELWQRPGNEAPECRKQPHSDLNAGGMKHIAFRVTDLQGRLTQLVELGANIAALQDSATEPMVPFTGISEEAGGGVIAAFICDPDGVLVALLDDQGLRTLPHA